MKINQKVKINNRTPAFSGLTGRVVENLKTKYSTKTNYFQSTNSKQKCCLVRFDNYIFLQYDGEHFPEELMVFPEVSLEKIT